MITTDPTRTEGVTAARGMLTAALARVAGMYRSLPLTDQPDITDETWRQLEGHLDRAIATGNRDAAARAIHRWEIHAAAVRASPTGGGREGIPA